MPDESYYKERGEEKNWPKILLMVLGGIILAIIIFLLIKGCAGKSNDGDFERDLLEAGKEYYQIDETLLPQATGECKTVTLDTLLTEELITKPENYADCNKDKTYVKVCKLESGNYHYLPVMQCGSTLADDNFTEWKEGIESDLTADKSDVRFTFKGEYLKVDDENLGKEKEAWLDELKDINYTTVSSTKYYRYRDLAWKWQTKTKEYYGTNTYYVSAPSSEYNNADAKTTGWKWYTESSKETSVVSQKQIKPTAFQYACVDDAKNPTNIVKSNIECSKRTDAFKISFGNTWTCDGQNTVSANTICAASCSKGVLSSDKTKCTYTEITKKYYPNGNTDVSKENTYYTQAPVSGAKKDEATSAQVSRYYKLNTKTTGYLSSAPSSDAVKVGDAIWGNWTDYQTTQPKAYAGTRQIETRTKVIYKLISEGASLDNWVAISDEYLSEADLIAKFQSLEYQVNTLEDIEKAEDLRYKVKLEYRDRK